MDLVNDLQYKQKSLDVAIKSLRKTGTEYAEAEKNYKMAVCKKVLELKDGGMPVTMIQLAIYGFDEIAQLRFKRDSAEVIYRANQESINGLKLEIRVLEEQINREFGRDISD